MKSPDRKRYILVISIALALAAWFLLKRKSSPSEGYGHFKVATFQASEGWGYRIYQDTAILIEQRVIPGVPGTAGFENEQSAQKTGQLVKQKLSQGIFPPTVTMQELDSLGIRYSRNR